MYCKATRLLSRKIVWPKYAISLTLTSQMQKWCHEFDMNFGGSWGTDSIIAEKRGISGENHLIRLYTNSRLNSFQYFKHWKELRCLFCQSVYHNHKYRPIYRYSDRYTFCPRKYGILFCCRTAAFIAHFGNKMNKQDLINIT